MRKEILFLTAVVLSVMVFSGMVMAGDNSDSASTTASATIPGWISMTLQGDGITFAHAIPGVNNSEDTPKAGLTFGAETNVHVKISVQSSTGLISGGQTITINHLQVNGPTGWVPYSSIVPVTVYAGLNSTSNGVETSIPFVHQLDVPKAQGAGVYTTTVTITAETAP